MQPDADDKQALRGRIYAMRKAGANIRDIAKAVTKSDRFVSGVLRDLGVSTERLSQRHAGVDDAIRGYVDLGLSDREIGSRMGQTKEWVRRRRRNMGLLVQPAKAALYDRDCNPVGRDAEHVALVMSQGGFPVSRGGVWLWPNLKRVA